MNMRVSFLSEKVADGEQRLVIGGKIRPGIKVLNNKALKLPRAVEIYKEGVAKRRKFSEIEKDIVAQTGLENPMYPRNTPYFNVSSGDFAMPELAQMIIDQYGEIREHDTRPELYRFPIIFHSDDLFEVYPNKMQSFGGSRQYASGYAEDGTRICQYLPDVTKEMAANQKTLRQRRQPRRQKVIRGICDPNVCPEFLQGACKFRGQLHFYLPGIPTTGLVMMETSSEYAAEAIWMELDRIVEVFGGIPRFNIVRPGAPIFYITKVLESRTYFDEFGVKQKGMQWVPKLQSEIDMGALLSGNVQAGPDHRPPAPVGWLTAPRALPDAKLLPASGDLKQSPEIEADSNAPNAEINSDDSSSVVSPALDNGGNQPKDGLALVNEYIDDWKLDPDATCEYLDCRFGETWFNDADILTLVIDQFERFGSVGPVCARKLMALSVSIMALGIANDDFHKYANAKFGSDYRFKEDVLADIEVDVARLTAGGPEVAHAYLRAALKSI